MTLDKAITELETEYKSDFNLQLAEWLKELKELKEQQSEDAVSRYGVPHKIAEFFSNWGGDETAKMEISVNDMREIVDVYRRKARIERQLKEIRQELCGNKVSL